MKVDTQPLITESGTKSPVVSQTIATEELAKVQIEENKDVKIASIKQHELEKEDKKSIELDREQLETMAQKLQEFVGSLNRGLEFSVHEDSGRDVIKVIDKNSGDTVRQYPSEEVLELVASLSDAAGNFVNIEA
ncbi:MAG: hypothetical protein BM565_03595 [Gammaproteobacteria bacterium MedPE]|nr:MAG: hypothetical protein BM565_03595 [Gammaproteobacteria bacterium MedPE]